MKKAMEAEVKRLEKHMTGIWVSAVIFTILFFPIGIIILIYGMLRARKISKIKYDLMKL